MDFSWPFSVFIDHRMFSLTSIQRRVFQTREHDSVFGQVKVNFDFSQVDSSGQKYQSNYPCLPMTVMGWSTCYKILKSEKSCGYSMSFCQVSSSLTENLPSFDTRTTMFSCLRRGAHCWNFPSISPSCSSPSWDRTNATSSFTRPILVSDTIGALPSMIQTGSKGSELRIVEQSSKALLQSVSFVLLGAMGV